MMPADLQSERRKIRIAAFWSFVLTAHSLVFGYILLPGYIDLPEQMLGRLVFVLRVDVFVLLWVLFGVGLVSRARRHSAADINAALTGPPSPRIAVQAAFLQNTLEQAILAIGAHLALATLLQREAMSLIVVAVALFAVGRVAFLWGYRGGAGDRAFGMVTTTLPTLLGYVVAVALICARLWRP